MLLTTPVRMVVLVSIGVLIAACGTESAGQQIEAATATVEQETEAATATAEPTDIGAAPLSETCASEADVERTIENFLAAFNHGDLVQLEAAFPPQSAQEYHRSQTLNPEPDTFQLYSVIGGGLDAFGGETPEEVLAYFEQRMLQHEQLQLVTLQILPYYELAQVEYTLIRSADDFTERTIGGHAWVNCAEGWIIFWSMGAEISASE